MPRISKFLDMLLEAQVYFLPAPNPEGESCRQPHSSGVFGGTITHPSQQTERGLLHAWQRDQEGFSSAADQLHARMSGTRWFLPACLGTDNDTRPACCSLCIQMGRNTFPRDNPCPAFFEPGASGSQLELASTGDALNA